VKELEKKSSTVKSVENANNISENSKTIVIPSLYKYKKLNAKAEENLRRNEFLRRRELGLEPIPPLHQSTLAIFDPERVQPVREEVNGKIVLKFRYIVYAPPMYEYDKGEHEVTVDTKTSAQIDEYLSNGITMLEIKVSCRRNDVRYKIEPLDKPSL
jgi:hypothetical protein